MYVNHVEVEVGGNPKPVTFVLLFLQFSTLIDVQLHLGLVDHSPMRVIRSTPTFPGCFIVSVTWY